jgi:hypothetical protein
MQQTVKELQSIVQQFSSRLNLLSEEEFSMKPSPSKWSKKEIIGHLIDSAHNNLRRFIVGQYDDTPVIVYDQDFWNKANDYQQMNKDEIIALWKLMNNRVGAVLLAMPASAMSRQLNTSKDSIQVHTLEWLAVDYVKHMKHHLNQVFAKAFDIVYP